MLICNYSVPAICLVRGLDDGFINPQHVASASQSGCKLCCER